MPTIVTPSRSREPSGLDKFLRTLSLGAGAASGIANVVTLPRRLGQEDRRLDLTQEANLTRQQQADLQTQIVAAQADKVQREKDALLVTASVKTAMSRRTQLFDQARAGTLEGPLASLNGNVDPALERAAMTLGDLDPVTENREGVRAAIARATGRNIEQVTNSEVLSEVNLPALINRRTLTMVAQAQEDPTMLASLQAAGRISAIGNFPGVLEGTTPEALVRQQMFETTVNNELLRIDPTTGEISGMMVNSPGEFIRGAFESLDLRPPPMETHVDGKLVTLPASLYDELASAQIKDLFEKESQRRTTQNALAQKFADEMGAPLHVGMAVVMGSFEGLSTEEVEAYTPFIEGVKRQREAVLFSVGTIPMYANFVDVMDGVRGMGLPDREIAPTMEALLDNIRKNNPSIPVPRAEVLPIFLRTLNAFSSGSDIKFDFSTGPATIITKGTVDGRLVDLVAAQLSEGSSIETITESFSNTIELQAAALAAVDTREMEAALVSLGNTTIQFGNESIVFTPAIINLLREEANRIRLESN